MAAGSQIKDLATIDPVENYSETKGYFTDKDDDIDTDVSDISRLRWNDRRLIDVSNMLQSYRPVVINIQQTPDVTDHEFVEEQEKCLQNFCIRTMAIPIGRGKYFSDFRLIFFNL